MNKFKVKNILYALVHIITPIIYLLVSIIWGHFFTSKSMWNNISDNLGILAIWYIGMSLLWFFSENYIDDQAEKISKEIEDKRNNVK